MLSRGDQLLPNGAFAADSGLRSETCCVWSLCSPKGWAGLRRDICVVETQVAGIKMFVLRYALGVALVGSSRKFIAILALCDKRYEATAQQKSAAQEL